MMNRLLDLVVVTKEEKSCVHVTFEHINTSMNMNLQLLNSNAFMLLLVVVQQIKNIIIPSQLFNDDNDSSNTNSLGDDSVMVGAGLTKESIVKDDKVKQHLFHLQKPITGSFFV